MQCILAGFTFIYWILGNLACTWCNDDDCDNPTLHGRCHNALKCFTNIHRETNGIIKRAKGCIKRHDNLYMDVMCSAKSYDGKDIHKKNMKSAQYNFECCRSNMCNENVTFSVSELPPIPSKSINI